MGFRLTYPGAVCSEPGCALLAAVATSFQSLLVPFGFSATYEEGAKRRDEKGKEQIKAAHFPFFCGGSHISFHSTAIYHTT